MQIYNFSKREPMKMNGFEQTVKEEKGDILTGVMTKVCQLRTPIQLLPKN